MNNQCFIIMPTDEPTGYSSGHFNLVYDYVVVPACRAAGLWPIRADNATPNHPLDSVKNLIDADMALFDISANNANALYGLAIRQALDLPSAVIKDPKSLVMFSTSDMNAVEYDDSLRIDMVQKAIEALGNALKNALEKKKERHPLLDRLGIGLPLVNAQATFDPIPLEEIHEDKPKESQLPVISPLPDYVGDPFTEEQILALKGGDELFHINYGHGKINFVKKMGKDKVGNIQFDSGAKLLVLVPTPIFRNINK